MAVGTGFMPANTVSLGTAGTMHTSSAGGDSNGLAAGVSSSTAGPVVPGKYFWNTILATTGASSVLAVKFSDFVGFTSPSVVSPGMMSVFTVGCPGRYRGTAVGPTYVLVA